MNRMRRLAGALLVAGAAWLLATPAAHAASGHLSFGASVHARHGHHGHHGHHFRNHPKHHRGHHRGHFRGHHRLHRGHHRPHHLFRGHHRPHHFFRGHHRPHHFFRGHRRGGFHFRGHGSHYGFALSVPLDVYSYRSYRPGYVVTPRLVRPSPPPPVEPLPRCLQTREFQTRIVIDGAEVDAYGTACLQPDGTWKQLGINLAPDR